MIEFMLQIIVYKETMNLYKIYWNKIDIYIYTYLCKGFFVSFRAFSELFVQNKSENNRKRFKTTSKHPKKIQKQFKTNRTPTKTTEYNRKRFKTNSKPVRKQPKTSQSQFRTDSKASKTAEVIIRY